MSPPTTRTIDSCGGSEAGRDSGERALEGDRVVDQPRTRGEIRGRLRGGDHDDLGRGRGDAVDGAVEKRPAVDAFGQLVSPEAARSAAGEHEAGDASGGHGAVTADRAARGPGTWPSGVRRRIPRRSRSSRMAITYLRLVPVASRSAAGVSGAVVGEPEGGRRDLVVGRSSRRRGRRRGRRCGPSVRARGSPPVGQAAARAASLSGGGAATASDCLEPGHRVEKDGVRAGMLRVLPGSARPAPSRTSCPSATSRSMRSAAAVTAARRPIVARRRSCLAAVSRTSASGVTPSPAAATAARIAASTLAAMSGATRVAPASPPAGSSTPCRSRRASAMAAAVANRHGRGKATDTFRGLAPPRDPARRRDIDDEGPDDPVARRNTCAGPTGRLARPRCGAASRTIAAGVPSGRSRASRPLRPMLASTAAVPRWARARARSGSAAPSLMSIRSLGTTAGSSVERGHGGGRRPPRRRR